MLRIIVMLLLCFSVIDALANQSGRCELESHDLSIFLEKREGLEKRFVVSAHDLMMSYCNNQSSSASLQSVFVNHGITDKDVGVKIIVNAVKVVSPFFKGISEVSDNRKIFSFIRGFYHRKYDSAVNENERNFLASSFNMTSLATIEIMNFR